jgi:hypothetical protein
MESACTDPYSQAVAGPGLIGSIPFEVYGLRDETLVPRRIAGIGYRGKTIELVALGHGAVADPSALWVQVAVTGPLQGANGSDRWQSDPLPMVASELLNASGVQLADVHALHEAVDGVLRREPTAIELAVDDSPMTFGAWFESGAWAAVGDIVPSHLLYVVARHIDPGRVELTRHVDLARYASTAS